jgi:D-alanyl-D-alanine carboxypeptidase
MKPVTMTLHRAVARLRSLAAGLALVLAAVGAAPAAAGPYLVYDAASGEVLAENQAFHPWYPASLTKLMTAYVTFRAMAAGEIRPDSPVIMSARAAKEPPSKMGFKPGTVITVDTALKIIIVKSANDVAMALGESVGGSEDAFVARMNAEARRLGMASTRFANPNGLPDPRQWTTARDFAILSRAIIREFPDYHDLFRITALSLGGKVIKTHNHLLERYPGTDGMKTGFICSSGFNVVASATRGGRRLVAVVFGERNAKIRAEKTAELLETAFDTGSGLFARRTKIENLRPSEYPPAEPTDMRPYVCGKDRDTGESADDAGVAAAGTAALEPKTYLVPRFKTMDPVPISLGGAIDRGDPLPAVLPPLPKPRPGTPAPADAAVDPALKLSTDGDVGSDG